ncbi:MULTISPECIES: enoyl-CoA hydratase/isomerase family protein [Bacillaceae]|uniref:Enoyl-CoA hydratase n=1 Tax=Domibacillus aminovorans TaxID=29332 RepID=A0A177KL09_9BACI|nr:MULTISPECIES: enoyl-CoA hydratase/isomerase family protein [Bacillaceae]OAH53676.1 enoyl-CoA hydratase [Domibacillus aminovorans]
MDYIVELDEQSGILLFTIKREEKRNAVNYAVMDGLKAAVERAKKDDVRVLAITGVGEQAFCSGGDLSIFHALRTEKEAYNMLAKMGDVLYKLATLPKPTVALLNGSAVGGGCEIAAACDYRIARTGVKIGFIQGCMAITTGWGGGTLLMERIEPRYAFKMLSEAAVFRAEHLDQFGFIDRISEQAELSEARAFFENEQTIKISVLTAYKKMLIAKWEAGDLRNRMKTEIKECAILWAQDAHQEAVASFLSKDKQ